MSGNELMLVGAGGHAKAIVEALAAVDMRIGAYVDSQTAAWVGAKRIDGDELALDVPVSVPFVLGLGGATVAALARRLALFDRYRAVGRAAPAVVHPTAYVSPSAHLDDGVIVLAGAVVQPDAVVEMAAIVNTGATVEHDSRLGAGSHLAPHAVLLGGATVGRCAMIGAGSVILPGETVDDGTAVPAASRFPAGSGERTPSE